MKKNINKARTCRTRLGRILARLCGEENGMMMEYVVIAVVIAAACALVFAIWGKAIFGQSEVAIYGVTGQQSTAATTQTGVRADANNGVSAAVQNQNTISSSDTDAAHAQQHSGN